MNQTVLVHCENALICDELGEEAKREGRVTAHDYVASRPVFTEVEAIRRVLYLAKLLVVACMSAISAVRKAWKK